MRRLFWVALGAAGGIYVAHQVTVRLQRLAPEHVANRVMSQASAGAGSMRSFWSDVSTASHQRESELRSALGLDDPSGDPMGSDPQRVADLVGRPGPDRYGRLDPPPTRDFR